MADAVSGIGATEVDPPLLEEDPPDTDDAEPTDGVAVVVADDALEDAPARERILGPVAVLGSGAPDVEALDTTLDDADDDVDRVGVGVARTEVGAKPFCCGVCWGGT